MTRESDDVIGGPSSSFKDWLDQQAESEGISQEELFDQLVSAYWTLSEMSQLVDEATETDTASSSPSRDGMSAEDQPSEPRDQTDRKTAEIDELRSLIEALQAELQTEVERNTALGARIETLASTLTELEVEIEDVEEFSKTEISDLKDDIQSVESSLAADYTQLKTELSTQFDDIETIFDYLIERNEDFEDAIANIKQDYYGRIENIERERKRLQQLKQAASDKGTYTGQCEQCQCSIDLALLTTPICPHCSAELTGIEEQTRWFVLSDIIVTTADKPLTQPSASPVPTDPESTSPGSSTPTQGTSLHDETASRRDPGGSPHTEQSSHGSSDGSARMNSQTGVTGEGANENETPLQSRDIFLDDDSSNENPKTRINENMPFGDLDEMNEDERDPPSDGGDSDDIHNSNDEFEWNTK